MCVIVLCSSVWKLFNVVSYSKPTYACLFSTLSQPQTSVVRQALILSNRIKHTKTIISHSLCCEKGIFLRKGLHTWLVEFNTFVGFMTRSQYQYIHIYYMFIYIFVVRLYHRTSLTQESYDGCEHANASQTAAIKPLGGRMCWHADQSIN